MSVYDFWLNKWLLLTFLDSSCLALWWGGCPNGFCDFVSLSLSLVSSLLFSSLIFASLPFLSCLFSSLLCSSLLFSSRLLSSPLLSSPLFLSLSLSLSLSRSLSLSLSLSLSNSLFATSLSLLPSSWPSFFFHWLLSALLPRSLRSLLNCSIGPSHFCWSTSFSIHVIFRIPTSYFSMNAFNTPMAHVF